MTIMAWAEMKTTDFGSLARERTVAVLPIAAVEQHGPHLPTGTDAQILEAIVDRLRARTLENGVALLLPLVAVGASSEHLGFPGTLSVGAETLLGYWCDLGRSVARGGIRRLLILNSHGGNSALAEVAALRLRAETGMLVATVTTHRLGVPPGLVTDEEQRFGIHAGAIETALMQLVQPALVDHSAVATFDSRERSLVRDHPRLGATGGHARLAWLIEDLHGSGAVGDAALATPAMGEAILEHLLAEIQRVLDDLLALDPPMR